MSNLEQEKGTGHEQVQKISNVFKHPPSVVNGISELSLLVPLNTDGGIMCAS